MEDAVVGAKRRIIIVLQRDHPPSTACERVLPQIQRIIPADIEICVSYEPKVPRVPALLCTVGSQVVYHYAGAITVETILQVLRELQ